MIYKLRFTDQAEEDLKLLKKSEPKAFKKAVGFFIELQEHPKTGTGKPHPLKGNRNGQWSRSITEKHRLIYKIQDTEVLVLILSAYGHYDDK